MTDTDGIDATNANLDPSFPHGVFVVQDGANAAPTGTASQNFKLVPLEDVIPGP